MKFTKGILIGGMITAGLMMMYDHNINTKKIMKKGKQLVKKIGII